jgi:hypothetical protein
MNSGIKNAKNSQSGKKVTSNPLFDCVSMPLNLYPQKEIRNLFFSLKSSLTKMSNQIDQIYFSNKKADFDSHQKNQISIKQINDLKEEMEIESGIILKKYGRVLHIFISPENNVSIDESTLSNYYSKNIKCFICHLSQSYKCISHSYLIITTNLLRKYYSSSIKHTTNKYKRMSKIMFYDLDAAIFKAKFKLFNKIKHQDDSSENSDDKFFKENFNMLSSSEMKLFRKFWIDLEEIRFSEKKEFLFKYYTRDTYKELFWNYFRINQFNLIRPKLHPNDIGKIQKSKFDRMWKLRQKILRHLVTHKSESYVLGINVSQLDKYIPENSHVEEQVGRYEESKKYKA